MNNNHREESVVHPGHRDVVDKGFANLLIN